MPLTWIVSAYMYGLDVSPLLLHVVWFLPFVGFTIGRKAAAFIAGWIAVVGLWMHLTDSWGWWPHPFVTIDQIKQSNLVTMVSLGIAMMALLFTYLSLVRASFGKLEELHVQQQQQDRQQVERLVAERRRIGRDLHDGPLKYNYKVRQGLELCHCLLEEGDLPAARARLQLLIGLVGQQDAAMRLLINQVRPRELAAYGLASALRDLPQRLGLSIIVQISNAVVGPLDPTLEDVIYYLVREALANVNTHAKALRAWVCLEQRADQIYLEIGDDGCGFNPVRTKQIAERVLKKTASDGLSRHGARPETGLFQRTLRPQTIMG